MDIITKDSFIVSDEKKQIASCVEDISTGEIGMREVLTVIFQSKTETFKKLMGHTFDRIKKLDAANQKGSMHQNEGCTSKTKLQTFLKHSNMHNLGKFIEDMIRNDSEVLRRRSSLNVASPSSTNINTPKGIKMERGNISSNCGTVLNMNWPALLKTTNNNTTSKIIQDVNDNNNNSNNNSNNRLSEESNNNVKKNKTIKKKRITLTNMSPVVPDKLASSGNIPSSSNLVLTSSTTNTTMSSIASLPSTPPMVTSQASIGTKHPKSEIDLRKFEKRLMMSDANNCNSNNHHVKVSPTVLKQRITEAKDDTFLKDDDNIVNTNNINVFLASSPSNVPKNAFTPVKLKIKRPPYEAFSPGGNAGQSGSPFERNLLSPSFHGENNGRKSISPFAERNLLSPSFDRNSRSYDGKNLFNIVTKNNALSDNRVGALDKHNDANDNERIVNSANNPVPAVATVSPLRKVEDKSLSPMLQSKCLRLGLLTAALIYNGYILDVASEIYFLFRLLKVAEHEDGDSLNSDTKHYNNIIMQISFQNNNILPNHESVKYYSGACLWGLQSIVFRSGIYVLKQLGSNATIKTYFQFMRDNIRGKLENLGMGKVFSKVPVGSRSNQNYKWWNGVNARYKRDDYNARERSINQNRIDRTDMFDQLYRRFEKQNQYFYDADWNQRFPENCKDCLKNTMPCNYPSLAFHFLKLLCQIESADQRTQEEDFLKQKFAKGGATKERIALFEDRMLNTKSHSEKSLVRSNSNEYRGRRSGSHGQRGNNNVERHHKKSLPKHQRRGGKTINTCHDQQNNYQKSSSMKKNISKKGASSTTNSRKKRNQHSNVSYGYASNDVSNDKMAIENIFTKSQEFFIYFIMYCDSHRFCEHVRIIAAAKIKELSGAATSSNEMLKQFEQRYLHIRVLGKMLGFLESSVFWSMGLDSHFQNINISRALESYIGNCTSWVEDAKRSIDVISQLHNAWLDGSLVSTVPWIIEYLKPLKFDTAYSRGDSIKIILEILWHIRNFALQILESRAGLLIVSCIDKLFIHLQPSLKKHLRQSKYNAKDEINTKTRATILSSFEYDVYGSKNKSLDSNVLDLQEGLVDDSVFKKSFKEFEYIALLFSERKKKKIVSSNNNTTKQHSSNGAAPIPTANTNQNTSSAGNSNPGFKTPAIKSKREKKYKLTPTNINDWRSSAKKTLSYWFYERHEILKELTDIVLDRCIKNSIKIAKDQYLNLSIEKIISKHKDVNEGLVESFNSEEVTLLQNCFRCAQILCKDDIERSILALAPAKYFHWNNNANHGAILTSSNSNDGNGTTTSIHKLPNKTLLTCIKLAISEGNKFLKEMLGDSIGAEFRRKINNWEKKNGLLKNSNGTSNQSLKWRRSFSSNSKGGDGNMKALNAVDDHCFETTNVKSRLNHISKMTNIVLSAPKDEMLKKTYQHNLVKFLNLLLEGQEAEHSSIDDKLLGNIIGFIQKDCLYLSILLFDKLVENENAEMVLKEDMFRSQYSFLSSILNFVSVVFNKLLNCQISTTAFGMSLLNGIGIAVDGKRNKDCVDMKSSIINLLLQRNILSLTHTNVELK